MNNYFISISLFLIQSVALYSVGAGLCLYRVTDEGIEFLLVQDPYQKSFWRQGFEFPGGTIGDFGHRKMDQLDGKRIDKLSYFEKKQIPVESYLLGAVRECLEELVFVPAQLLKKADCYKENGTINKTVAQQSIQAIAQEIKIQGQIYLRTLNDGSNYTIFFWDITKLSTKELLQSIQNKRNKLLSGWFSRVSRIGAEPDQFAWVASNELKRAIYRAQDGFQKAYFVKALELSTKNKPLQSNVTIRLSPAFIKFISRVGQEVNQEESMLAIINFLEQKHL